MNINFISAAAIAAMLLSACGNDAPSPDAPIESSAEAVEDPTTAAATASVEASICVGAGPQTPRDISSLAGANPVSFALAPAASEMNLCNIHTHTNAEHRGPGFNVFNETKSHGVRQLVTAKELLAPIE